MKNTFGNNISITLFGESHGEAIGCVLDGIAPGIEVDEAFIADQMEKRKGINSISTPRREADKVRILSGVFEGKTTGTPIALMIENPTPKKIMEEGIWGHSYVYGIVTDKRVMTP